MQFVKTKYQNFLEHFTPIVWSMHKSFISQEPKYKKIHFFRTFYAILVSVACLISLISLVNPSTDKNVLDVYFKIVSVLQIFSFFFFVFDYISHIITYKIYCKKINKHHKKKFKYKNFYFIFTFFGIVQLLCILASIHVLSGISTIDAKTEKVFDYFKILNLARVARFFAILTMFSPFRIISNVFKSQKKILMNVLFIALFLIIIFAFVIWSSETQYLNEIQKVWLQKQYLNIKTVELFNDYYKHLNLKNYNIDKWFEINKVQDLRTEFESINLDDFTSLSSGYITGFLDALYFSVITLTTIGYGDVLPHAPITKIIVSLNALIALAIIAIPSGVIASAFLAETQDHVTKKESSKQKHD
ncbi:potassium channel family protein [Mycoplasma leonicaptivi]|uniref:potassium channel family protein n=1 Tax=Mycoplasma leonicaptivi TaxID=36742 RepID=UPI00047F2760|nr:potassium channel family protein [Mycoplasma leonicaptivi]